ncbi:MAG: ABC transporter ATP-binding protein [Planctomycetes bacterium]|nr:ABC transporter ATP-binding protein [Planctomycetota bacterium]
MIFAFLGPNGAGKTTTVKIMTGLVRPTAGEVRILGIPILGDAIDAKRRIGFVPDQPHLYERLTGREFLRWSAALYGVPDAEARERIARYARIFDCEGFLDGLTGDYSHGMKQRVALASAFVHEPEVLILDEPTVGLDPAMIRRLKDFLRERAEAGLTVFLSTHALEIAEELAHRIGIIDRGRLVEEGTYAAIAARTGGARSLESLYLGLVSREEAP